jgi:anti-sigma factor RsiW
MMMTHEDVVPLLPELLDGELDAPLADEAQQHMAGCRECDALGTTYRQLMRALRAPQSATHPISEALVSYATGFGTLTAVERRQVEAHLAGCAECSDDVAATREAMAEQERTPHRSAVRRAWMTQLWRSAGGRAAVAAAAVFVVLAVPAWRGLRGVQPVADGGSTAPLVVLNGALRGAADLPVVSIASQVVLAFDPALPSSLDDSAVLTVSIDNVWSQAMTAGELRHKARVSGVVVVVVPGSLVSAREHLLQVVAPGLDGVLFEARFVARR